MVFLLFQILGVLFYTQVTTFICEQIDFSKTVTLGQVVSREQKLGCTVKPSPMNVGLGNEYYPNLKEYDLQNPMVAECESKEGLALYTEYFFTPDSIVRVLLATWNTPFSSLEQSDKTTPEEALIANKLLYQDKITELQNILIERLGQPYLNAAHKPFDATSELLEYKWKGAFNAELSVVFSNKNGYSRLRLLVFRD